MRNNISSLLIVLITPLILGVITHFGYISGYTTEVISEPSFRAQYENGIYKYRVLSRILVVETDKILRKTKLNQMDNNLTRMVRFMDINGTLSFYFAYFVVNSSFAILSSLLFFLVLSRNIFDQSQTKAILTTLIFNITVPIFQYVLVPYDYSSYFFNLLIIWLYFKSKSNNSITLNFLMLISIILATLNRETSALSVSFILTFEYLTANNIQIAIRKTILPIVAFLSTYLFLRIYYGFETGVMQKFTLFLNLVSPLNLFGIFTGLFSVYILYYFSQNSLSVRSMKLYLIFSLPYIITSMVGGITYEIRLWAPLLINLSIILLYFNTRKI